MSENQFAVQVVREITSLQDKVERLIRRDPGPGHLSSLHDVFLDDLQPHQILRYQDTTGLWVNRYTALFTGPVLTRTIVAGAINAAGATTGTNFAILGEGGLADDLDTITSDQAGHIIVVRRDPSTTITLKHGTGNLRLGGSDIILDTDEKAVWLLYTGSGDFVAVGGFGSGAAGPPAAHAATHQHGGADEVATDTPAANSIPKSEATGTLAAGWIPDLSGIYAPVVHVHAGEDITSGTIADARIASTITRDSEVFTIVLAADGAGSLLDADLLDGVQGSGYALASHVHSGADITTGTVADARIASTITRDSEVMTIVLAADGAGSLLDADLLDGLQGAAYLLVDGSRPLTGDWDIGASRRIFAERIRARSNLGLELFDDSGLWGLFVADGGVVSVLNVTRPTLAIDDGVTASKSRIFNAVATTSRIDITHNLSYDGANWNLDDTAQNGSHLNMQPTIPFLIRYVPAGANPVSPSVLLYLDTNGDLSLGTGAAPTAGIALEVVRDGVASSIRNVAYGTGSSANISMYSPRGTSSIPVANALNDDLGSIYFGGWDTNLSNGARIAALASAAWTAAVNPTDLVFYTATTSSLVERVRMGSTGLVNISGRLDVLETATNVDAIIGHVDTDNVNVIGLRVTNHDLTAASITGLRINMYDSSGTERYGAAIGVGKEQLWTSTGTTRDAYMVFMVAVDGSPSNKMWIKANGNIGIGTADPSSSLDVYTNVPVLRLSDANSSSLTTLQAYIEFYDRATARGGWIGFGSAATATLSITNEISGGDIVLMPTGVGAVGIGNASPLALLHVGAGADATLVPTPIAYFTNAGQTDLIVRDSTSNVENRLTSYSGGAIVGAVSNHDLFFRANNADYMALRTGGYVDINVGASAGMEGRLRSVMYVNTTAVGNIGTGEDQLMAYTIPANTLNSTGDSVWFEAAGTVTANGNTKNLRLRFGTTGTTLILETSGVLGTSEHNWMLRGWIVRTGASAQKIIATLWTDPIAGGSTIVMTSFVALTQALTSAIPIRVMAEGVSNNDVVCEMFKVGFDPVNT